MMTISLSDAGKRFNRDWIFRNFNYQFTTGKAYAITGPNGAGKSTLLQCIAGATVLSTGKLNWYQNQQQQADDIFKQLSIAAPYLELIEEMTLAEFLAFHESFKCLLPGYNAKKIIDYIGLQNAATKQLRYYSSGMKQRVKLAQAIFSDVQCILLDEPCTNFDTAGIALYQQLINDFCKQRMVIVSSNDVQEYSFCEEVISILDYK
jgi:ABC-type multidrug transport system ATPase subunit